MVSNLNSGPAQQASSAALELDELLSENVADAARRADGAFTAAGHPLVLYGAGTLGRTVLERLRRVGIEPVAFADDTPEKQKQLIDGVPVMTLREAAEKFARVVFVVTILNPMLSFRDARKRLRQLTDAPVVSFLTLAWKFPDAFLPYCQFELPQLVLTKAEDIRRAFRLWSDEESRRQFVAHLRFRLSLDYGALPENSHDDYFPSGVLPRLPNSSIFVDCGAYDGDTVKRFLAHQHGRFDRIYAFEPDAQNCERLRSYVASLGTEADRIHVFNAGVGARRARLRFDSAGNMGSSFSRTGASEVDVMPLDEMVEANGAPVYLKFDVEGGEWEALKGCARLLASARPLMAISVYHRPDDLWQLPLHIDSLGLGYRFFLRTQGEDGMDVICYAIPEKGGTGDSPVSIGLA